jgi:hypothetical protein
VLDEGLSRRIQKYICLRSQGVEMVAASFV